MTIEEFNNTRFGGSMYADYKGDRYQIASVDFEESLVGLFMDISGGDEGDISWVRCENCTLVE